VYAEYRKAPEVTRKRLYLETMQDVLGNTAGTTIVDKKLGNVLPVKNLTSGIGSGAIGTSGATAAAADKGAN
jgi:membrane protease subunit HflK